MRAGFCSDGLRLSLITQRSSSVRAGKSRNSCRHATQFRSPRTFRRHLAIAARIVFDTDTETRANQRPRIRNAFGRLSRQHGAAQRVLGCVGFEQRLHRVPCRRCRGRTEEQATFEAALDK